MKKKPECGMLCCGGLGHQVHQRLPICVRISTADCQSIWWVGWSGSIALENTHLAPLHDHRSSFKPATFPNPEYCGPYHGGNLTTCVACGTMWETQESCKLRYVATVCNSLSHFAIKLRIGQCIMKLSEKASVVGLWCPEDLLLL